MRTTFVISDEEPSRLRFRPQHLDNKWSQHKAEYSISDERIFIVQPAVHAYPATAVPTRRCTPDSWQNWVVRGRHSEGIQVG